MATELVAEDNILRNLTEIFFQKQLTSIVNAFQEHLVAARDEFRERRRSDLVARLEDPATCWSEKPLCNVIEQIPLPEGFIAVGSNRARVEVTPPMLCPDSLPYGMHEQMSLSTPHNFAVDGAGNVLCVTPGQWQEYDPFSYAEGPGSKIAVLQQMAPGLVINFPGSGVGFLVGPKRLLLMELGLVYSW